MKFLIPILLLLLLINCKSFEKSFINQYKIEVLYSNENSCYLFSPKYLTQYKPKKCFTINFGFSENEYQQLRRIYLEEVSNPRSLKSHLKKGIFPRIYFAEEKDEHLVSNNYGLFQVSGKVFAPNFYFLRNEKNIYFYNCKNKKSLLEKLNRSKTIDTILKKKISLFIIEKCKTNNGLKWHSGARFH